MRDRGVGHRVDHLGALLDHAVGLVIAAHHEAGDVLQEHQRDVGLVAQLDEGGALLGRVGIEHAVVGQDAHRIAADRRPAADEGCAVASLVLLESGTVHHPGDHLAHVEGLAHVTAHQPEKVLWVVHRLIRGHGGTGMGLLPVEVRHRLAAHADGVHLVHRQVVAQPGNLGVQPGAAEGLIVGFLAGGHLDQGRPGQEDLGLVGHHDVVVGKPRLVGAARGGRPEHHAHRGYAHLGQLDHLVEEPARLREVDQLSPAAAPSGELRAAAVAAAEAQVGARGLHEAHIGDVVVAGDLEGPHPLLAGVRGEGSGQHAGVVAHDHALGAADHSDADHHPSAHGVVGPVGGQRADLQERAVGVDHVGDALPDRQLAPRPQSLHRGGPSTGLGLVEQLLDLRELLQHVVAVLAERLAARVHRRRQRGRQQPRQADRCASVDLHRRDTTAAHDSDRPRVRGHPCPWCLAEIDRKLTALIAALNKTAEVDAAMAGDVSGIRAPAPTNQAPDP